MNAQSHKGAILELAKRQGLVRPKDLERAGIPRVYLSRMVGDGTLKKLGRGLYALPDYAPSEDAPSAETRDAPRPELLSGEVRVWPDDPNPKFDDAGKPWPKPTKRQLLAVASLAAALDREAVAHWPPFQKVGENMVVMPVLMYGPTIERLTKLVYEYGLVVNFDWTSWSDQAWRLVNDEGELAKADLVSIQKLLTCHFRKDRFCEGHLAAEHRSGHLAAVLRRIGAIAEGME